jgi:hypothetical protein
MMPMLALLGWITPGAEIAHSRHLIVGEQATPALLGKSGFARKACNK